MLNVKYVWDCIEASTKALIKASAEFRDSLYAQLQINTKVRGNGFPNVVATVKNRRQCCGDKNTIKPLINDATTVYVASPVYLLLGNRVTFTKCSEFVLDSCWLMGLPFISDFSFTHWCFPRLDGCFTCLFKFIAMWLMFPLVLHCNLCSFVHKTMLSYSTYIHCLYRLVGQLEFNRLKGLVKTELNTVLREEPLNSDSTTQFR